LQQRGDVSTLGVNRDTIAAILVCTSLYWVGASNLDEPFNCTVFLHLEDTCRVLSGCCDIISRSLILKVVTTAVED
jgi:hypothetical protein